MKSRILLMAAFLITAVGIAVAEHDFFKPVTTEMLENPNPSDWLNWRRTLDGWGHSPLSQINTQNAEKLQLIWSWALPSGMSQPNPLVYNGIMYVPTAGNSVIALNATNGEVLWQYDREFETKSDRNVGATRNIAIYGDKIYLTTKDAHVVALRTRDGEVAWDTKVVDPKLGYTYSAGPIIAKGKVIAGMNGCGRYKNGGCYITAHDPETGKELWRTSTVASPGEPGGDTWGELEPMFRAGSDMWVAGSYDPKADLVYWSTAQSKPWSRRQRNDLEGNELYTNSTLALNPDTGKIVWYHQYVPAETHDMDETFESLLIDQGGQSYLFHMGKLGVMWKLDRNTGKFVAAYDTGYQTLYDVDPKTGKTTLLPNMNPVLDQEIDFCPSMGGHKTWRSMSYHPGNQVLYIPMMVACNKTTFVSMPPMKEGGSGSACCMRGQKKYPHPKSPDNIGLLLAMDAKTGKTVWEYRTKEPMMTSALTTAGGLVMTGNWDGHFYIFDAAKGKVLYQTKMPTTVQGFPITYSVNGRQYVAVPVGTGDAGWGSTPLAIHPEMRPRPTGNAMFVFALPEGNSR